MEHPPINIRDAYFLAEWKYQFSISPRIAREEFDEILGECPEWIKDYAREILRKYDECGDWMKAIDEVEKGYRVG